MLIKTLIRGSLFSGDVSTAARTNSAGNGAADLPKWEKQLKEMNDLGKSPKVVSITMPYTFATISTIVTYLIHTFAGRKPMSQVGTHKKETTQGAQMMELTLQYNADHTRLIRHLFQFLNDGIDVLNLLGGGTSAPINKGAYILPGQTDVIGIAA